MLTLSKPPLYHYGIFFLLLIVFVLETVSAKTSNWDFIIPHKIQKISRAHYAERAHLVFRYFLNKSLHSKGRKDFNAVTERVHNRIFWRKNKKKQNPFVEAYHRSYPSVKNYKLPADIPHMILLMPYLESLWQGKVGDPKKDYGYWQILNSIVDEIKTLPSTPRYLKKLSNNKIRSNYKLSTRVALIHLRRYHFYFNKVARFSNTDAWLFSMVSYNWGSGNVRRLLHEMKRHKIKRNFSNFYHYLYKKQQKDPDSRSLTSALEYLPHLWNIAQVIRKKKR